MADRFAAPVPSTPYEEQSPHLATPEIRTDNDYLTPHAQPQTEVGQSLEKLGQTGEQLGNTAVDYAIKKQQLLNETASTQAETALIQSNAAIKAKFMATEGSETTLALPAAQKAVLDNFNNIKATLPAGAARQFDMLGLRQLANYSSDFSSYEAGQAKKANMMAHASLINAAEMAPTDPDVANNPARVGDALGTVTYSHGAMLDEDHPGLTKDDDGNISFKDNPEGQNLQAHVQNNIAQSKGIIWQNTITTLADQDPVKAETVYNQNKNSIPPLAQTRIEAFLNPKVDNYKVGGIVNGTMLQANRDHQDFLLNPPASLPSGSLPSPADFIAKHEGGYVSNDSGKGLTNFGINQESNPDIDVKSLTADQAKNLIQTRYADAIGADKMSPQMALVATDAAVNMGVGKTKQLLAQADGDPQKMIDLRRTEYQRLADADPDKYGASLAGWNNRLDDLQKSITPTSTGQPVKRYATNADGSPVSLPDYYAANRDKILAQGDAMSDRDFPGNPAYKSMVRERLTQQMNAAISSQSAQYKQDNQYIMKAISGDLTKGTTPMTYQDLRQIPGVDKVLDRVAVQDPKFYDGIDKIISHVAQRGTNQNSPNAYDTIQRATISPDDPDKAGDRIASSDHLDKLLGKSDGTGINMKDYTDAKPLIESTQNWKDFVSNSMRHIANANGNVDGQGQTRAVNWYNQVSQTKKNEENKDGFDEQKFIEGIKESSQPHTLSRMEQLTNWAKNLISGNQATPQAAQQTATGANGEKYVLQGGQWVKQ